ncbi:hypothetical protein EN851_23130 [Mesorhizobium sp. M8A.F.Ca.ET.208.01.1.1]|uniref:hypothetical protein n=1 Tax=unclassified Mesorhizobium TaxID=325217 RepID=UPI001092DF2C|nr:MULTISPECIES: hypothetical protein [unclassified Mesorhizobium]TGU40155.1 hypothetical protein EN799_06945 [bacterium M00.F.Ca.ET.156.01.1.1]TGV15052.1 hypothetical protein EN816_06330 [Mesorhizobium sp. M8A.F.Ca.ET.173.01.1.1]TGQ89173.1 hypothetical protein EN851_23130 [Mesorhizobium sp. M8A.F.Ca.ET.208.01.1.1]TGR32276.1 hypothetical protein EN845_06945 [Mesorhizobium sp. M8A.F.Ca.ET.202.01.1.1]TGT50492.1 hypothetical protein EN810_23030 [Mesorhizobium sp. M8A.F.Ca.ET.167.01.1.1]
MTLAQISKVHANANDAANDNPSPEPGLPNAVSLTDEENIADLVRRTERTAMWVLLGMGGWLAFVPVVYLVMTHGI